MRPSPSHDAAPDGALQVSRSVRQGWRLPSDGPRRSSPQVAVTRIPADAHSAAAGTPRGAHGPGDYAEGAKGTER